MKKVYVEITNSCNLDCEFCHNTNREKVEMTPENFEYIINQVKNYTDLICLHVKGEPLFHSNLDKILEILDKNNLKTNITTNGTLLNYREECILKHSSVRQINISLHSSVENSKINIKKYMEKIFLAVSNLEKNNIIISYRLWNLNDYKENDKNYEIIKILEEYYNKDNLLQELTEKEWIKIKENIFINQDKRFVWPNLNSKVINDCGRCLGLKEQFGILVNGDVIPCCIDSEGEITLGNIYKSNLKEILNSNRAIEMLNGFKNKELKEELCKRCGFLQRLENKRM